MAKTATVATATPKNKFQGILASTGQTVLDRRAELLGQAVEDAMKDKIRSLKTQRNGIELRRIELADLSVESNESLRPGGAAKAGAFNATAWVDEMCSTAMEIALLDDEIEIAEQVYQEYFTPVEEAK